MRPNRSGRLPPVRPNPLRRARRGYDAPHRHRRRRGARVRRRQPAWRHRRARSLTVPTTEQARAIIDRIARRRRRGAGYGVQERACEYGQGRPRLGAGRHHAAQVEHRQPGVDPRLRAVAQLRQPRHQRLHGRHPDQHRRRPVRSLRDRSDRLPLCRGLQGRQRAALRRQLAGWRDQFRHADRPRCFAVRGALRRRQLRLRARPGQHRRSKRTGRLVRHRFGAARGRISRAQQRQYRTSQCELRLSVLAGCRDALLCQRELVAPALARRGDQDRQR